MFVNTCVVISYYHREEIQLRCKGTLNKSLSAAKMAQKDPSFSSFHNEKAFFLSLSREITSCCNIRLNISRRDGFCSCIKTERYSPPLGGNSRYQKLKRRIACAAPEKPKSFRFSKAGKDQSWLHSLLLRD